MLRKIVLPRFGSRKVAAIQSRDIHGLHVAMKDTPYQANRVLALLSKMFSMAVKWGWRSDNPAKGIERFQEHRRERWLSDDELSRLLSVLSGHPNQRAANAVRLQLLTGARIGEVLSACWSEIDRDRGVWTKPSHHTKQKQTEHLPLSALAIDLLADMKDQAREDEQHIFPGNVPGKPLQDIKNSGAALPCRPAWMITGYTTIVIPMHHTWYQAGSVWKSSAGCWATPIQ